MLIAKSAVAQQVLDHLPCSRIPEGGYFGGKVYVIGVRVRDVGEAFDLGATMGSEAEFLGDLGFDKIGAQQYVVFRSAEVAEGPDMEEKPKGASRPGPYELHVPSRTCYTGLKGEHDERR